MYKYHLSIDNIEYEECSAELESHKKYSSEQLEQILKECCQEAVKRKKVEYHKSTTRKRYLICDTDIFSAGIEIMMNERNFKPTKQIDACCSIDPYGHCEWLDELKKEMTEKIKLGEYKKK